MALLATKSHFQVGQPLPFVTERRDRTEGDRENDTERWRRDGTGWLWWLCYDVVILGYGSGIRLH